MRRGQYKVDTKGELQEFMKDLLGKRGRCGDCIVVFKLDKIRMFKGCK